MTLQRWIAVAAIGIAPAACAGGVSHALPLASHPSANVANRHAPGWLSPQAAEGTNLVYVSSQEGSTGFVNVYPAGGQAQLPIGTIVDGINLPAGLALDSNRTLYVANSGNNTVTAYPEGQKSPSVTYTDGIGTPQGVAVGPDGTLYVANETGSSSGAGTVTEYPPGSTSPSLTISLPGELAFAVALDSSGQLYVSWFSLSSYGIQVYRYAAGSSTGTNLNLDLPTYTFPAYQLAFDDRGRLVVPCESLDHNPPKYFALFKPGESKPVRKLRFGGLLDVVGGLAFSKRQHIFFAASENLNDWMKLTYPKMLPRDAVNVGLPVGIAVSD